MPRVSRHAGRLPDGSASTQPRRTARQGSERHCSEAYRATEHLRSLPPAAAGHEPTSGCRTVALNADGDLSVGSGIAGLSTAWELARTGLSVIALEGAHDGEADRTTPVRSRNAVEQSRKARGPRLRRIPRAPPYGARGGCGAGS
ncbi:FAD-dependent oxidoreductase [Streptomyces venezuelae]|uniref:FAD-dependent oxidoreductase n=1 Tax=Streptomyces venezuelae TaxID=54571 RepID=UPI0037DD7308